MWLYILRAYKLYDSFRYPKNHQNEFQNHLQHLFTFPVIVLGREAAAFPSVMNGHPLAYMNACLEMPQ